MTGLLVVEALLLWGAVGTGYALLRLPALARTVSRHGTADVQSRAFLRSVVVRVVAWPVFLVGDTRRAIRARRAVAR